MRRVEIYDTLSREKRLFQPITPPRVGLFVCGLTPYADAHIGHGKFAVTFDVVARALRRWGYRVFYVQNVTNLDDRLIERGSAAGVSPFTLADRHFFAWLVAMERLDVRSVNYYPHATDYLPEILEQIAALVERGFAYVVDGAVYYDVGKFANYGKLSGQRTEALRPGTRLERDPRKHAPEDFVLWKPATPGEPSWPSPWGPGRPGWHIEDTAITVRLLGPRYDLHGAATDLKFPHHEAEIAQAEAATGQAPLVNYWMHMGLLLMNGEKMSKSVGNVFPLDRALGEYGPAVLRFFYLNAQYRSPLDFVPGKSLEEARSAYDRLRAPYARLRDALGSSGGPDRAGRELPAATEERAYALVEALDALLADDFNTREAIARLFGWGNELADWMPRLDSLSGSALEALAAPYRWAEELLGLFPRSPDSEAGPGLAAAVEAALAARARARARGDFAEADRIRDALASAGLRLEDEGERTRWTLVPSRPT